MPPISPRNLAGTDTAVGFMWGASITACLILIAVCLRLVVVINRRGKKRELLLAQQKEKLKGASNPQPQHSHHRSRPSRMLDTARPDDKTPLYEKIRLHNKKKSHTTTIFQPKQEQRKLFSLPSLTRPLRRTVSKVSRRHAYPRMQRASAGVQTRMAPMPRASPAASPARTWWQPLFKQKRASSFVSYDVLHNPFIWNPFSRASSKRSARSANTLAVPQSNTQPTPYVTDRHPGYFLGQYHVTPLHTPQLQVQTTSPAPAEVTSPEPEQKAQSDSTSHLRVIPVQNTGVSLASSPGPAIEDQTEDNGDSSPQYPATASSRYSTLADGEQWSPLSAATAEPAMPVLPLHMMPFRGLPLAVATQSHRSLPMSPAPVRPLPYLPAAPDSPGQHSEDEYATSAYTSMRTSSVFSLESNDPSRYTIHVAPPPPAVSKPRKLSDHGLHIWMEEPLGY